MHIIAGNVSCVTFQVLVIKRDTTWRVARFTECNQMKPKSSSKVSEMRRLAGRYVTRQSRLSQQLIRLRDYRYRPLI